MEINKKIQIKLNTSLIFREYNNVKILEGEFCYSCVPTRLESELVKSNNLDTKWFTPKKYKLKHFFLGIYLRCNSILLPPFILKKLRSHSNLKMKALIFKPKRFNLNIVINQTLSRCLEI